METVYNSEWTIKEYHQPDFELLTPFDFEVKTGTVNEELKHIFRTIKTYQYNFGDSYFMFISSSNLDESYDLDMEEFADGQYYMLSQKLSFEEIDFVNSTFQNNSNIGEKIEAKIILKDKIHILELVTIKKGTSLINTTFYYPESEEYGSIITKRILESLKI
jgi:hypothetical protein